MIDNHEFTPAPNDTRALRLDPERGTYVPAIGQLDRLADQERDALPERRVIEVGGKAPATTGPEARHDLGELREASEAAVERAHRASYGVAGQLATHAEAEAAVKAARDREASR